MAPVSRVLVAVSPGDGKDGFFEAVIKRAAASRAEVTALYVVDPVWLRYSEADWLSTGPSRADYESYMHEALLNEGEGLLNELALMAKASKVPLTAEIVKGGTAVAEAFLRAAASIGPDEIAVSASCPCLGEIRKKSRCPVLVI